MIGMVTQESVLFNDSVYNNILMGKPDADREEVEAAAKIANAHDFILNLSDGYDTNIGDDGNKLSGGQKQRVSIARALIRKTPILLLDEATSSLDNQVTTEIESSILDIQNLTALVVTHKLNENILKKYDRILFMKDGVIVEDGSFSDLMDRRGEFYKLFELSV